MWKNTPTVHGRIVINIFTDSCLIMYDVEVFQYYYYMTVQSIHYHTKILFAQLINCCVVQSDFKSKMLATLTKESYVNGIAFYRATNINVMQFHR